MGNKKVPQIGPGKCPASITGTGLIYRPCILGKACVLQVYPTAPSKDASITGKPRGDDTIEHINASCHPIQDILGHTDAHHVARLFMRKQINNGIDHVPHKTFRLSNA